MVLITDFLRLHAASKEVMRVDLLSVPHLVDQLEYPQCINGYERDRVIPRKLFEGFENGLNLSPSLVVPPLEFSIVLGVVLAAVLYDINSSMEFFLNYLLPYRMPQLLLFLL